MSPPTIPTPEMYAEATAKEDPAFLKDAEFVLEAFRPSQPA